VVRPPSVGKAAAVFPEQEPVAAPVSIKFVKSSSPEGPPIIVPQSSYVWAATAASTAVPATAEAVEDYRKYRGVKLSAPGANISHPYLKTNPNALNTCEPGSSLHTCIDM
jgi:hypothetical protein